MRRHRISVRAIGAVAAVALLVVALLLSLHSPTPSSPNLKSARLPTLVAAPQVATSVQTLGDGAPATGAPFDETPTSSLGEPSSRMSPSAVAPTSVPRATARSTASPVATPKPLTLRVPILWYHRIVPSAEAGDSLPHLVVSPELFSAQLETLKGAGWHTITLAQLGDILEAGRQPSARTVVITFDDGWSDGYTYALPILKERGFVATFFVIPGRVGNATQLSGDQIRALEAAGNEIGNHGMNHVKLTTASAADLQNEIVGGEQAIAQITGTWPQSFAYPYGVFDTRVVAALSGCRGLLMAVAGTGTSRESWSTRFQVYRLGVGPTTTPDGLLAMVDAYN